MPAELGSMFLGDLTPPRAAIKAVMPDKVNAIDYKFSLVGAIVSLRADTALVEEFARFKMIK